MVALTPGSGVELVSYLPGRRVTGVRVGDEGLEVHVVARYGPTMVEVAQEVREALRPLLGDAVVGVVIHDIDIDPDDLDIEPDHRDLAAEGVETR